jgi:hypothetical protein
MNITVAIEGRDGKTTVAVNMNGAYNAVDYRHLLFFKTSRNDIPVACRTTGLMERTLFGALAH